MMILVSMGYFQRDSSAERMAISSRVEVKKFDGNNFELWKLEMEDLLVDKEQWVDMDIGSKPTSMSI
jgi:hypothetical protein